MRCRLTPSRTNRVAWVLCAMCAGAVVVFAAALALTYPAVLFEWLGKIVVVWAVVSVPFSAIVVLCLFGRSRREL